eukprot:scaffold5918_cov124-Isochrysis_galbana.AAC.2
MFSYPFSRSGNETEDGTHFPRLEDLQYLCELAGIRLKVTPPSHPQPPNQPWCPRARLSVETPNSTHASPRALALGLASKPPNSTHASFRALALGLASNPQIAPTPALAPSC